MIHLLNIPKRLFALPWWRGRPYSPIAAGAGASRWLRESRPPTYAHCRLRTLVVGERPGPPPLSHLPGLSPASGPAHVPASLLDVTSIFSSCTSCLCTAGSKACWVGASPRPALSPPAGGSQEKPTPWRGGLAECRSQPCDISGT